MGNDLHGEHSSPAPGHSGSLPGAGSSRAEDGALGASPPPLTAYQLAPPVGSLSATQADAVARMVVQGRPLQLIAMAVGRSPESLRRMIAGSLRPKIDEVRAQVMREVSAHWFEMLAMLPQARQNMQSALLSPDESTRVAMSKWIHERIVPPPAAQQEVEHTIHFGEEVAGLLAAMNDRLAEIQAANKGRDPLARVRSGPDALPRPVIVHPSSSDDTAPDAA